MDTPPSVKTVLDSVNGSTLWAASMQAGRPWLTQVLRIAMAATVNLCALSSSLSTTSSALVSIFPVIFRLHSTLVWADTYEEEKFGAINSPALSPRLLRLLGSSVLCI